MKIMDIENQSMNSLNYYRNVYVAHFKSLHVASKFIVSIFIDSIVLRAFKICEISRKLN